MVDGELAPAGPALLGGAPEAELSGIGRLLPVGMLGVAAAGVASLFSLAFRFRRSRGEERQQLVWFLSAVLLSAAALALAFLPVGDRFLFAQRLIVGVAAFAIPAATGVAILRYRLYDFDLVVNRTLVYTGLSAVVFGIFVASTALAGRFVHQRDQWQVALPAAVLVAVVALPLRDRLQTWANQLMYGERDDPYGALARLGRYLESVRAPGEVLPGLVATVATALRLSYAAVHLDGEAITAPLAAWGRRPEVLSVFPLTYQGATVGSLVVSGRAPGQTLSGSDRRVLEALAAQAGVAVHAERLTLDLQRSRQQLVSAREEERRRLRRDLHDGLGPTLAGVALGVEAASNVLGQDPQGAAALLAPVHEQVKTAIDDIRRLVNELRDPALDELGLLDALRGHALRFQTLAATHGDHLQIQVVAPESLPQLPAAAETATYRIALEALTNVVRHAHVHHCSVRINVQDALEVEVVDDGRGLEGRSAGVGMASMKERAAELGGVCTIQPGQGRGTRVFARLPLSETA